jgi:hypothetical protein
MIMIWLEENKRRPSSERSGWDSEGKGKMHCMKFPNIMSIVEQALLTIRIIMSQKGTFFFDFKSEEVVPAVEVLI